MHRLNEFFGVYPTRRVGQQHPIDEKGQLQYDDTGPLSMNAIGQTVACMMNVLETRQSIDMHELWSRDVHGRICCCSREDLPEGSV
jgi:hypothetical protein